MRLTLAALLLAASSSAWAGERAADASPAAPSAQASSEPSAVSPAVPYAALYDAPLFGHSVKAVDKVDETALHFYAGQRNRIRVDAEIKRLRGLHPDWAVPPNLYAAGAGDDEQPLWDLFAAGRTEELRLAIQARQAREPDWRPSADLLAKLSHQETATALTALSEAREWERLLALANAHPDTLGCGTVDLDWRVGEAFARIGLIERAFEVDAAILKTCKNDAERLATVRKAIGLLPDGDVERLIASGRALADGSGEFDALRLDLARRQIGDATARADAAPVPVSSLSVLGAATLRSGEPADAALLGWYYFRRKQPTDADGWFKLGLAATVGDVKMAEGHALSLRDLGRLDEAEQLAHAWRDRSRSMRELFVSLITARLGRPGAAPTDPSDLADLAAILKEDHDVAAAGALAWAAYARHDLDAAALWFGRAVDWGRPGEVPETVIEGYGLTLVGLGRLDAVEEVLYGQRDRSPGIAQLYLAVTVATLTAGDADLPPGVAGPTRPAVTIPPERMDRFTVVIRAARSTRGAAALGWRALRDGRPSAAADWFREVQRWSPDGVAEIKSVEGLVLALKASGDLRDAEDEAFGRLAESAQLREAYRGVMVAELTAPDAADQLRESSVVRFARTVDDETWADGAQALGWYRLGRSTVEPGGCGYGVDWFRRAIDWSPDHRGTAKMNEGYAQALQRAGHDLAAADVAEAWADRSPEMKTLAIKVMAEALTRDLFPQRIAEDRADRLASLVRDARSVSGAQALGWYRYRDAGLGYGVGWFENAILWSPDRHADAKTFEGYASALRDIGRLADAEEALFPWVDRVPLMRDLYIDTVVSELTLDDPPEPMPPERLARFVAVATTERSAAAAQAIGWYRFARGEDREAVTWFKTAVDWWPALPPDADRYSYVPQTYEPLQVRLALKPEDYRRTPRAFSSRVHDPDASRHRYVDTFGGFATTWTGYTLALQAVGRAGEAADIAYAWRERWPAMSRLFVDIGVAALTAPDGAAALSPDRMKRFAVVIEQTRDAEGAAALAWAASARRDPTEAVVWFKAAKDWQPADAPADPKILAGYVDALRAGGRTEEAFVAAASAADRLPDLKPTLVDSALDLVAVAADAARKGAEGHAPATERLAQAIALAEADSTPRSAATLGWYWLASGRPQDALSAFKTAIERSEAATAAAPAPNSDAATLPKAVEGYARTLLALGRDADALVFADAWSARVPAVATMPGDLVAEVISRDDGAPAFASGSIDGMATIATRTRSVPAAAAFGWFFYRHRDWAKAAAWFASGTAWSPDHRGSPKLAEGYAASLHNQCRFAEAESAALERLDAPGSDELRRIYVDSVADRISRGRAPVAMLPAEAARFAALTMASASANGAQALGWYAYRSRQFAAAAAWFERAVTWHPTEAEIYGLALSLRRIGDGGGLLRVLDLYEGRYPSLAAVRAAVGSRREPSLPNFGDLAGRTCEAGEDTERAVRVAPLAEVAPLSGPAAPIAALALSSDPGPAEVGGRAATATRARTANLAEIPSPAAEAGAPPASVLAHSAPRRPIAREPSAVVPTDAAAALAVKDYGRCLAILARRGLRGAFDRTTQGWCLLGVGRSAEAAEAFRAAGPDANGGDGALGASLAHLGAGDTEAALADATHASLDADKRRTLGVQILAQQAHDAYAAGRWAETLGLLRRRSAYAPETRDLVLLRGWARYQTGDYDAARRAFAEADAELSDADSRKALATVTLATTPKAFR